MGSLAPKSPALTPTLAFNVFEWLKGLFVPPRLVPVPVPARRPDRRRR